ncbi:hypothetical protein TPHA_0B00680 [Tetrapisispora phaffii CBS 4417]|uniref:Uncharacterized protein n=1 Tax=Tetrapisispora phaffii (strain ATCC 24235 / CBS 4417 / NBRC 1672 / NRRL Y-8282 / UCD 70-5) TaxID=1071381 RepID=G8BQE3_TETPH|nr:hypothetical protein TPHA_0B00680 [Tetrapisispora phaffii CBS 4417]CCE61740.1 hypothetical protein TPHA_0B00680 [Tetrapisispora phaffii CBS 4417]
MVTTDDNDPLRNYSEKILEDTDHDIEIDELYQGLNKFILLIGDKRYLKEAGSTKHIANFLRLNFLSYLRKETSYKLVRHKEDVRIILTQWWVTLLNFLNSDADECSMEVLIYSSDIDVLSVCLECISKILSKTLLTLSNAVDNLETFSHHILITLHYMTNRLILSSRLLRDPSAHLSKRIAFLQKYNSLLRSFLGKLNAYAFFFLPDSLNFDIQLLMELQPNISLEDHKTAFSWKKRKFFITDEGKTSMDPKSIETEDTQFFKIIISYLKQDMIFTSFYWHYWYIIMTLTSSTDELQNTLKKSDEIPGLAILLKYVTWNFLSSDLHRLRSFNSSKLKQNKDANSTASSIIEANESMPDSDMDLDVQSVQRSKNSKIRKVSDQEYNNFIICNFRSFKLWECLRSLSYDFGLHISPILGLHDGSLLSFISTIPAYDSFASNIVYNKLFQFILFQFDSIFTDQFINWRFWCRGILMMLKTFSIKSEIIGLTSLFNIWKYIPNSYLRSLEENLIYNYWDLLIDKSSDNLTKILFVRLIVFKILQTDNNSLKMNLKKKLYAIDKEASSFAESNSDFVYESDSSILSFNGNRIFSITANKQLSEGDILLRKKKLAEVTKGKKSPIIFSSIIDIATSRVSVVLKNGKYPYDVIDELSTRATLLDLTQNIQKINNTVIPIQKTSTRFK